MISSVGNKKQHRYSTTSKGFTLLELLITLVIASMALTLVAPKLAAVIPGVQLKTETNKLSALLKHTRSRAISEGDVVGVYLYRDADVTDVQPSLKQTGLQRRYDWPQGYEISIKQQLDVRDAPEGIYFYPDGSSNGGSLTLSHNNQSFRISVSWLSGEVKIDD